MKSQYSIYIYKSPFLTPLNQILNHQYNQIFTFRFLQTLTPTEVPVVHSGPSGCDFDSASTNSTSRARQRSPKNQRY